MTPSKRKLALPDTFAAVALLVLTIGCALLLLAQPRAVPLELPSLTLPADAVAAVVRADARGAHDAPTSPEANKLEALIDQQGQSEVGGFEGTESYVARRDAIAASYQALVASAGEPAAMRLRAKAVLLLEDALELRLADDHAKRVIGAMSTVFDREGVSRNGELVAPRFVARTFYKARWNILSGLAPAYAFERVELRTFYGWQALHAERLTVQKRIEALHAYGLAGGDHVEEALGVLLYRLGDYPQAVSALEHAYRREGSLRLRNCVFRARAAAMPAN